MSDRLARRVDAGGDAHRKTVIGAVLGFDLIVLLQLLTLSSLDKRLTVALYCFAISIPLLALHLRVLLLHAPFQRRVLTWYSPVAAILGLELSVIGLAAIIFHLSVRAGYTFAGFVIFGLIASHHYRRRIIELNSER